MKRIATAVIIAGLAGGAWADTWSVGYGAVAGHDRYVVNNNTTNVQSQADEAMSLSQVSILYQASRRLGDQFLLTFDAGLGLPMSTYTHDATKEQTNNGALASKNATNEGDSTDIRAATVPALIGARYVIPAGENLISVGVGIGPMIVGFFSDDTAVTWTGAVPNQVRNTVTLTHAAMAAATYQVLGSAAFHLKVDKATAVTIQVNAGTIGEVRFDTETTRNAPGAGVLAQSTAGYTVGGMTYGVQAGWSRSF